jgi:hypothetical protein
MLRRGVISKAKAIFTGRIIENRAKKLQKELTLLFDNVGSIVLNDLMGLPSPPAPTGKIIYMKTPFVESVKWAYLSQSWIKTKKHNKFFIYKGDLRKQIQRTSFAKKLGVSVMVSTKKTTKELTLGDIIIDLYYNVPSGIYKRILAKNYSNSRYIHNWLVGPVEAKKLVGPKDRHRPLVIPVLYYHMKHVVPKTIERVLKK